MSVGSYRHIRRMKALARFPSQPDEDVPGKRSRATWAEERKTLQDRVDGKGKRRPPPVVVS